MRIVFRADGSHDIGLGHIYRSLALVEMLNDQFDCLFLTSRPSAKNRNLIKAYCSVSEIHSLSPKDEPAEIQSVLRSTDIVVIDGYHFDQQYQKFLKSTVAKLVMIDDKADHHYYYADLIINHGDASVINKYKKDPYTKVLAGFKYAIVRKEFLASAKTERQMSNVDTVFICMGGADPFNITIKAVLAALKCDFIKSLIVVTGSAYSNKSQLEQALQSYCDSKVILHEENVSAVRLVELIRMSQIAIAPASSIAMEICCVKAGLLTGTVVGNQDATHRQLTELGCCISLGNFNTASEDDIRSYLEQLNLPTTVNELMRNQSKAIDGLSGERLLNEFKQLAVC